MIGLWSRLVDGYSVVIPGICALVVPLDPPSADTQWHLNQGSGS